LFIETRLKVLHVYRTYFPDTQGGLEEVIRQICINTKVQGIESRVFTLSKTANPVVVNASEATVYRSKQSFEIASCGFSAVAFLEFKQHVEWADIIHYQAPWPFADLLHLLIGRKKPAIVTYQSDVVRQKILAVFYKPLMNLYLGKLDRIVATSTNYVKSSPVLNAYKNKIEVIPIGIDRVSYPAIDEHIHQQLKQKYGEGFFFFIGVLRYYKGLSYLLDALEGTDYPMLIAGSGPEEQGLKKQAKRLNLKNVIFLGRISDEQKMALYQLSKVVVFPSCERSEAYGVTLVEAAMNARPMISTELQTGTSYVNKDGETGIVVEPKNVEQLKQAMEKMQNSPELIERMGYAAYQRYLKLFTGKKMGESYAKLYKHILK